MASTKRDPEAELIEDIASFTHDPLGYVLYAFPWGVKGSPLEKMRGPRRWQREYLERIGQRLRAHALLPAEAIQMATATGHGVGKSALFSMIAMWAMSTMPDTRMVVTANTEGQLTGKTWPELAKWQRMAINAHWFTFTATALYSTDPKHEKTWRADLVPWSDSNTEAFAGLHNQGRRIVLVFDEASAIADNIWEVAEGALTDEDTEILWLAFGNPTRNTGRFFDCFHRYAHRWDTLQLDSRTVEGVNRKQIDGWVRDNGEDSDFVRVRVRGVFPRASMLQLISREALLKAMDRKLGYVAHRGTPVAVGVDVARFGQCQSVIVTRIGRDASQFPPIKMAGYDTVMVADAVAEHVNTLRRAGLKPVVFVDGGGVGGGVVDILTDRGYAPVEVQFGSTASDPKRYANKRAEMYGELVEWLPTGVLPKDDEMLVEGPAIEYTYTPSDQKILVRKERMLADTGISPDTMDALALTFAHPLSELTQPESSASAAAACMETPARRTYDPRSSGSRR